MAINVTDIGKSGLYVVEGEFDIYLFDNYDAAVTCKREECNGDLNFYGFSKRPSFQEAEMTASYYYPNYNIINRV